LRWKPWTASWLLLVRVKKGCLNCVPLIVVKVRSHEFRLRALLLEQPVSEWPFCVFMYSSRRSASSSLGGPSSSSSLFSGMTVSTRPCLVSCYRSLSSSSYIYSIKAIFSMTLRSLMFLCFSRAFINRTGGGYA
jgi:hypothetical protein